MATPQENMARFQEIANRGLQDNLDPQKRAIFDEAINRGLITIQQVSPVVEPIVEPQEQTAQEGLGPLDTAIGAANIFNRTVTSLGEQAVAGIGGVLESLNPFAEEGAGARQSEAIQQAIPDIEIGAQGQQLIADISKKFQASPQMVKDIASAFINLGPSLSESTFQATGSPLAAVAVGALPEALEAATGLGGARAVKQAANVAADVAADTAEKGASIFTIQSPTKQRIEKLIGSGSTDVETAKFKLAPARVERIVNDPTVPGGKRIDISSPAARLGQSIKSGGPKLRTDVTAVETIRQGFDEGVIAAIKGSSRADKIALRKMTNIMERGKKNARFAATNRPSDVVGDTLLSRVDAIRSANRTAGQNIDKVAQTLKGQPIDLLNSVNTFAQDLNDLGVRLVDNGKGGIKPDFELSQLSPGDRGPIKEVIRQMNIAGRGQIDGLAAHKMKRIIDNNVTFGKVKTGISGDGERVLKSFRASIDDALDTTFPKYNQENVTYSETIGALNSLQDSVGRKLDFSGDKADKALGTSLRGILSNNKSRINLLDSVEEIEAVARKHGAGGKLLIEGSGGSKSDLLTQILFVDELDRKFGPVARTSFQGQIDQAVRRGAGAVATEQGAVSAGIDVAAKLAEKARGINDEAAFKSIKKLLRE